MKEWKKKRMNGNELLVNDPVHLSARPVRRALVMGRLTVAKPGDIGPYASYYTSLPCGCASCRKGGVE